MIKMFEEYNLKNINGYQEISSDHDTQFDQKYNYEKFSDEEYSIINNKVSGRVRINDDRDQIIINNVFNINITKYEDEWFIVTCVINDNFKLNSNHFYSYYLCDQFYNLIKCLEGILSKYIKESSNSYYYEISSDDYHEYWEMVHDKLGIKDLYYNNDMLEYSNRMPHFSKSESDYLIGLGFKFLVSWDITSRGTMVMGFPNSVHEDDEYLYVYKGLDDWYIVRSENFSRSPSNMYYKCDQWEGLLNFLDNLVK